MRSRMDKAEKKKWILKDGFNSKIGRATSNQHYLIPNYVQASPSQPPVNYNFRTIVKNKWISEKGFY